MSKYSDHKAGWDFAEYGELVGIRRTTIYALPKELQPESIKIRGRRVIIEPPKVYVRRLADAQRPKEAA